AQQSLEKWRAAKTRILTTIADRCDRGHHWLQNEAESHWPVRTVDEVVPETRQGLVGEPVQYGAGDDQHDGDRDDELGQKAQFLRFGIHSRYSRQERGSGGALNASRPNVEIGAGAPVLAVCAVKHWPVGMPRSISP